MKDLQLKWKLFISFGVPFLLVLVLGISSLSVINMMTKTGVEYAEEIVPAAEEIGLVRRNMVSVRRYLLNAMIAESSEDYQRVSDSMNEDRDALYHSLEIIEGIDEKYRQDIEAIREKVQSVSEYNGQIMELSEDLGDQEAKEQAYDIYLNTYAPAFTEAADMIVALNDKIDETTAEQEKQVKDAQKIATVIVVLILTISLLAVIFFTNRMLKYILTPAKKLLDGSEALARGDFEHAVVDYRSKDEFGELAGKITGVMQRIVFITKDLQTGLRAVEEGNFDAKSQNDEEYEGEYHLLRDAVYNLMQTLNDIMCQVRTTSNQVADGAEQVAHAAQTLSQGSSKQASSVQELAATLTEISQQVDENTQLMGDVETSVNDTVEEVAMSTAKMQEMLAAMYNINDTSAEIEKIIKSIEDIAFQTNILSLNAAVEAARAGEAGKGFAVVADEVRRLAANTAEASKNTTELISKSTNAVENGKKIADETAASLRRVTQNIEKLSDEAKQVAENSYKQDRAIKHTSAGVEQISGVVQNNSATAEESAAASEALSGQAGILREIVSKFSISCSEGNTEMEPDTAKLPCGCGKY